MMKNWENNGTGEIGLVTPTPDHKMITGVEWSDDMLFKECNTSVSTPSLSYTLISASGMILEKQDAKCILGELTWFCAEIRSI